VYRWQWPSKELLYWVGIKAVRKIVVLNVGFHIVLMLATAALAQDRHFPAALGSPLPPLQQTAPRVPPPRNHHVPIGPGYWGGYGYGGYASAVWVQGNDVRYVDADDENHRVPLADVDRSATRALNQARNLNLRLPPPAQ
jgi:hypothetical protein